MPKDSSQASGSLGLNDDDLEKMISDAVFYCLIADQKKAVIKKGDLYSKCDLTNKRPQVKEQVFSAAREHLIKTFGINLTESNTKKGSYYLTNALKESGDEEQQHICWGDRDNAHMALTFIILGQIFMSNGKVADEQLFKCLKKLGIYQEDDRPGKRGANRSQSSDVDPELLELFDGDIKKFVNEVLVTKQQYLRRDKVETNDPEVEVWEYSWGERAKLEVKESDVLKMVCELYECEATMFKEQYDKVVDAEGEEAMGES